MQLMSGRDLSAGGIGINLPTAVALGTRVDVSLVRFDGVDVKIPGRVVRRMDGMPRACSSTGRSTRWITSLSRVEKGRALPASEDARQLDFQGPASVGKLQRDPLSSASSRCSHSPPHYVASP